MEIKKEREELKENAWYQMGKTYAQYFTDNDLNMFFKNNNIYIDMKSPSNDGFKKGIWEKFMLELIKKDVNIAELSDMYLGYNEKNKGMDKYFFYWGYDNQRLIMAKEMTFAEAAERWGLADSTLRKLVTTDKLEEGIDYRKSGKVWLITEGAMIKIYGYPQN
ncbi:helix-turn-helix domain-containing protein [uncultured Clostridium sp.]|uniref:helix-turn-helix domain-containing protein n=1 Tax=uncultured Clostridium sp. TaxID=59620 RepID=UPI00261D6A7D|nr:helix-turn-helix domain-containing protein [uncultured Clostridium sp.]